jgi:hypothetical protein
MKDLADFIRFYTPWLTDLQRYNYISSFHFYLQIFLIVAFFITRNIFVRLFVLGIVFFIGIYADLTLRDCWISVLEREFHSQETWDDILDIIFKKFDWKITRSEKIVGFICAIIGIFISFSLFALYQMFF